MSVVTREISPSEVQVINPKVERSAKLLDKIKPGWADKIDLDDFNVASPNRCVLGQVYRSRLPFMSSPFIRGLKEVEKHEDYFNLAFYSAADNEDWRLEIQARKTR